MAGKRKVSDLNVGGIRYAVLVEKVPLRQVAELYGISHVQVWRIINGHQRNATIRLDNTEGKEPVEA